MKVGRWLDLDIGHLGLDPDCRPTQGLTLGPWLKLKWLSEHVLMAEVRSIQRDEWEYKMPLSTWLKTGIESVH